MQRANFEMFGSTLFLDMMKRQLNSVHWPYVSIVALDGDKKVVSCGEAFCCQEVLDVYTFNVLHVPQSAIFDGGALLRDMGMASTCHIVLDQYHLMEVDWKKYFGLAMFEGRLREPLYQYLCSDTEVKLEENYLNIRTILSPN